MNNEKEIFDRFPEFIKEFIYKNSWQELRAVQIEAGEILFNTNNHLLLTSATASGKTEAVFFPIITKIMENPKHGVRVIYISPLKSLINDQFFRMEDVLLESGIPVCRWHGDVASSNKKKLLETPEGILQITPESLESMLINRSNDICRIFDGLEYVVIDEIHTLVGSDRGNQIICQIERLERLLKREIIRIGLSATVGNPEFVANWLKGNSKREVSYPIIPNEKIRWKLGIEHFFVDNDEFEQTKSTNKKDLPKAQIDAGYEFMYDSVYGRKALCFSNSREETEYLTATFRQIASKRGDKDTFLIHHGNLSASLREEAESKMKNDDETAVTCATVTLELGVDIGRLERVLQNGSPNSVSSFLQRLGRSGRRGNPPEMIMAIREENALPNTPLPELIPWELIKAIAIVQLYIEKRFIETPNFKKMPLSLMFHQTLSALAQNGELKPKALADKMLSMPPFLMVDKEIYKELLISMSKNDFIEMTDEGGFIIGLKGEKLLKSFKFYAVFKDSDDFTVRCGSDEIGTITTPPPVGDRFALAGKVWEVEDLDVQKKLIYVKAVLGKMEVSWPGDYGEIDSEILRMMRRVLTEDKEYPYLLDNAQKRLEDARILVKNTGMADNSVLHLGGYTFCIFPWLGTRSFRTFRRFLQKNSAKFGISGIEFESCYYIKFKMDKANIEDLKLGLYEIANSEGIKAEELVFSSENPVFDKYDDFLPPTLLRKAFSIDRLRTDEVYDKIIEIYNENAGV